MKKYKKFLYLQPTKKRTVNSPASTSCSITVIDPKTAGFGECST